MVLHYKQIWVRGDPSLWRFRGEQEKFSIIASSLHFSCGPVEQVGRSGCCLGR